jgi:hypothetical protein
VRKPEAGTIESSAGAEFSGQESDEGELGPLPEAERLKELLLRVLESERNRVYGGNWQGAPLVRKMTQQQGTANGGGDQINSADEVRSRKSKCRSKVKSWNAWWSCFYFFVFDFLPLTFLHS